MAAESGPQPTRLKPTCGALGALAGAVATVAVLGLESLRSLAANGQWFRLAETLSDAGLWRVAAGLALGALGGVLLTRIRPNTRIPFWRVLIVVGALTAALASSAWLATLSRRAPTTTGATGATGSPNILLVVLDTTRRDHLSLYGYGRDTTPYLRSLTESSTVFTNAYSTSAWTGSAHASLFTGLYPATHHVTQESWRMPATLYTLPEILWERGYYTAAMVGNPMVGSALGFAEGFDAFHETWREANVSDASQHAAVRHLDDVLSRTSGKPFFAFVNLIEPHSPYISGPHLDAYRTHPDNELSNNHWRAFFAGDGTLDASDLEHLSELYDGELRHTDDIVARLLEQLDEHGALDDTIVVITADHGENFGEHGLVDHVFNLYDTTTTVPLVIRYPRAFPALQRDDPVQLHDVFTTLLSLTNAPGPRGQGVDLSSTDIDANRPIFLSYGYPNQALNAMGAERASSDQLDVFKRRLWAVRIGTSKLIRGDDGLLEFYDLAQDPAELANLALVPEHADSVAALGAILDQLLSKYDGEESTRARPEDAGYDAETLEQLRALGYAQ